MGRRKKPKKSDRLKRFLKSLDLPDIGEEPEVEEDEDQEEDPEFLTPDELIEANAFIHEAMITVRHELCKKRDPRQYIK